MGPGLVGRDEGKVDLGLHQGRQLHLGLLRRFLQTLKGHPVLAEVDPLVGLKRFDDPLDDPLVEVVASEMRIAVGRLDLDDALTDFKDGDVEGASAEVIHRYRLVLLLVEAVGERGRRWLVDDPHHLESGDLSGILGRLPLGVVEVRGHGDDSLVRSSHRDTPRPPS